MDEILMLFALGLLAMAAAVALDVPMTGAAMPSSGKGIGARTVLSLRKTSRPDLETGKNALDDLRRDAVLVPAR